MPITQVRLLSLITAAEHFQATSHTLRESFNQVFRRVATGQLTTSQALTQISEEFNLAVPADATHAGTIMAERVRYNITWKRNSVERRRIWNRRHPTPDSPPDAEDPPPRRTAAEVAAFADSTDDALAGLEGLANEAPPPDPTLDPMAHDPAYLAWKATRHQPPDGD